MNTTKLVYKLKENEQDFEFYPTTKEMVKRIYDYIPDYCKSILDIGCGTCNFKKYINEYKEEKIHDKYGLIKNLNFDYYVIEKSKILIDALDKDSIVLGVDFNKTLLIDKPCDVIFCNPPYSEYENWTKKIIFEGNYREAFLIIPERWKNNDDILNIINKSDVTYRVIGSYDFLDGERKARAKVDILRIIKKHRNTEEFNIKAFDDWFNETFNINDNIEKKLNDSEKELVIKNKLVSCSDGKAKMLVDLYNEELNNLFKHFKAITSMDSETLETIGICKENVKQAIRQKTKSLKIIYWKVIFDELEEITSRLTYKTREKLRNRYSTIQTIDFNLENIYPLILWVIKNSNSYFNQQLIDFYMDLSRPENVKPYKSNKKVFENERWRFNQQKNTHYTLDYRIILSHLFDITWNNNLDLYKSKQVIDDICAISNNLGFIVGEREIPKEYGEKYYIYDKDMNVLVEFKVYKNRNTHVKFNIELTKAMNVEVSRLLGWIREPKDIKEEFPEEMAKGAEKYFKSNFNVLSDNKIKLLN